MYHPRFVSGDITTAFIEEEYPDGFSGASLTSESTGVFVATAILFIFWNKNVLRQFPADIQLYRTIDID